MHLHANAPRLSLPTVIVVALLTTLALSSWGSTFAQPTRDGSWSVGVILSISAGSPLGAQQARLAESSASALGRAGVFGAPFVTVLRDDRGDPRQAELAARELIDEGVLALVCCTSPAASERVARLAAEAGIVMLGLDGAFSEALPGAGVLGSSGQQVWTLSLRSGARTQLTAVGVHAAEEGKSALALMTLDNTFGDEAAEAFERAMSDAGRQAVGTVQYSPSATVLTPEALWAATREPGAVVVWGLATDTAIALDALRRRGWFGPAYVRAESLAPGAWARLELSGAAVVTPPVPGDSWWGVRVPVAPISLAELLPPEHPNRDAALEVLAELDAAGLRLDPVERANVALVADALTLLQRAFEEAAALRLPPGLPVESWRQAVLDALLSAPPRALSAGTYQARSGDSRLARWQGLVIARTR